MEKYNIMPSISIKSTVSQIYIFNEKKSPCLEKTNKTKSFVDAGELVHEFLQGFIIIIT